MDRILVFKDATILRVEVKVVESIIRKNLVSQTDKCLLITRENFFYASLFCLQIFFFIFRLLPMGICSVRVLIFPLHADDKFFLKDINRE